MQTALPLVVLYTWGYQHKNQYLPQFDENCHLAQFDENYTLAQFDETICFSN